ncbi:MAG: hypothetical protein H7Z41_04945 [Cytophagales bacterium]|nr:hypothetical protein [Armatimonadota bacterium]
MIDAAPRASRDRAVTGRAVGIGLLGAALLCAVTPYNDYKIGATFLAGNQFPVGAVFALLLFAAPINALLRSLAPARTFSRSELLTIWTLMLVASGLPSSGMMRFFLPHIAAPGYFSNGGNNWEGRIWGGLPGWLNLSDRDAATAYFTGYPRGAEHIPWAAWIEPLLGWGAFAVCFFVATFSLANLLRRQWIENEKFVFPLVSLPLLLAEDPAPGTHLPPILRQPLLWCAVAFTTGLHGLNGLHQLYPAIPALQTAINLETFLTTPPWNQIGPVPVLFFPLVVGLSFLLPAEVAFSLWFFFLFYKAEILLGAVSNWDMPASLGSPSERQFHALQGFGGALGLMAWTLWSARRHLRDVWEKAIGGPRAAFIDDSGELFSYRATVVGLATSYVGMAVWLRLATVPWPLVVLSLLMLTLSLLTISWVVTQAGTLYMVMPCMAVDAVGATVGTQHADPGAWYTVQRIECLFYRDTRELLLPEVLSGAKVAEASGMSPRSLFPALIASVVLGIGVSLVASLWLPYFNGGANSLPNTWAFRTGPMRPLQMIGGFASTPVVGSLSGLLQIGGGFLGVAALLLLRARYGFGLHPIGFIGASVISGRQLWFSILLGWFCKTALMRFGGMRGYRSALPFFIGLMLGDVMNAIVWTVIGSLTGVGYNLLPQ